MNSRVDYLDDMTEKWEQRWHPLRQEWVVIAGHRQDRPWSGETLVSAAEEPPPFEQDCYLCPGNTRVSGVANPDFKGVHVFDNDHPCVGPRAPQVLNAAPRVYANAPATGQSRVICYGPEHHLRLSRLPVSRVVELLQVWQQQYRELGAKKEIKHVLIFENNGEAVGVSNPHPHGQIYATNFVFKTTEIEVAASQSHLQSTGRGLFQEMIASECEDGRRILDEETSALSFVPYCARSAYEVFVAPRERHASIADLSQQETQDLAVVLRSLLIRFDNLWKMSFPYVMVLHNAPTDGADYSACHFYISLHPPLRKPNLLKYLAGPELGGGNFIADTWPEDKAAELRACSTIHYREGQPT